jgi:hypothetical protein
VQYKHALEQNIIQDRYSLETLAQGSRMIIRATQLAVWPKKQQQEEGNKLKLIHKS